METQIEIVSKDKKGILTEYAKRINECHLSVLSSSKKARGHAEIALAYAFECGKLLCEVKKLCNHGEWNQWTDENCNFDRTTAWRYSKLYSKSELLKMSNVAPVQHLEEVEYENVDSNVIQNIHSIKNFDAKNLKQAYMTTGILPQVEKSVSDESSKAAVVHVKYIDSFITWYRKTNAHKPAKNWNPIEVVSLIQLLEPITEIYNELVDIHENL